MSEGGTIIGGATILCGDCISVLGKTPAEFADAAFVDPPYNIGFDYGRGKKADLLPDADFVDWLDRLLSATYRALKPDGTLWIMMGEKYTDELGCLIRSSSYHRRRLVVWYETFGVNQRSNFSPCARFLHYCVKDKKKFTWNPVRVPSARQEKYKDKRAHPDGKVPDSVWTFSRVCGTFKEKVKGSAPNQIPIALVERAIRCTTRPGDVVLDCCAGTFTTAIAARNTGRRSVMIEQNPKYVETGKKRLEESVGK